MRDPRSHTWVVIAAFNEGPAIRAVVERVISDGWRCVVVDDGSRDATGKNAEDGGAIVLQQAVAVEEDDTPQTLQRRVMEQAEWKLLPRATELVCRAITEEEN